MKQNAPQALQAALYQNPGVSVAECWTFTLPDGLHRWTSYPVDVQWTFTGAQQATTWQATGPGIRKGKLFARSGVTIDSLDVQLFGTAPLFSGALPVAAAALTFRGATVTLQRVYFDAPGGTALGCVTIFSGTVMGVTPDAGALGLEIRSALSKPAQARGTRPIQYTCPFSIYDADCAATPITATVALTTPSGPIRLYPAAPPSGFTITPGDLATMTSGAYAGFSSLVRWTGPGYFDLATALPGAPAVNDTMTLRAGCNKERGTCGNRFNNLARHGGAPDLPAKDLI